LTTLFDGFVSALIELIAIGCVGHGMFFYCEIDRIGVPVRDGLFDQIVRATLWLIIANAASSDAPPCRIAPPASPAY
jgi:hypothetical protein